MKTFSRIFLAAIILSLGFSACKDKVDPPTETPFNKYDTITNFQGLLIPTTGKLKVNIKMSKTIFLPLFALFLPFSL